MNQMPNTRALRNPFFLWFVFFFTFCVVRKTFFSLSTSSKQDRESARVIQDIDSSYQDKGKVEYKYKERENMSM